MIDPLTVLSLSQGRLTLEHHSRYLERPFDVTDRGLLTDLAERYRATLKRHDPLALLAIGQALYQWLDRERWLTDLTPAPRPPWLFEVRSEATPGSDGRALLEAPWELLADTQGHLSARFNRQFTPYRRLGLPEPPAPPGRHRLGLLFMAAAPWGETTLAFEQEEAAILAAVGETEVELTVEESGNLALLAATAAELARTGEGGHAPAEVVHLSCHGGFIDGEPRLLLEEETGEAAPVGVLELMQQPPLRQARLLFISACHSAEGAAPEAATDSLAQQLLQCGFPALLGWGGAVRDDEAIAFAATLYLALARRTALEQAVGEARFALQYSPREGGSECWHLARLFLGPEGGGPLAAGGPPRRPVGVAHGIKEYLDAKGQQVPVARRSEFVGRRRPLQQALRELRGQAYAGVVIHGMGRQGKSSLAARIANRLPGLRPVVLYGDYRAERLLRAFLDAGLGAEVNRIVREYEPLVRREPERLADPLQALLHGPCAERPVLLIIDDLEQVLEAHPVGLHLPRAPERAALLEVVRAFSSQHGPSRLLLTSRYNFQLPDRDGRDLASRLLSLPLPPMDTTEQRKQLAQRRKTLLAELGGQLLVEDSERTARLLAVARGNPGLQELLYRLSRSDTAGCDRTLTALEGWLAGRALGTELDEGVRSVLEGLALGQIYHTVLAPEERYWLGVSSLFELPLPAAFVQWLAPEAPHPKRLLALGLWDSWPDPVIPQRPAVALNPLVRAVLPPLAAAEQQALACRVSGPLLAAWAAEGRPPLATLQLARLALLGAVPEVAAATAGGAVEWLYNVDRYHAAAELGQGTVQLLQGAGQLPPLPLLRASSDALVRLGEIGVARELMQLGLEGHPPAAQPHAYAALLLSWARLLGEEGEPELALRRLEQVQGYFTLAESPREYAIVSGDIARIRVGRGEVDAALELHEERLGVFERLGDQRERAVTLGDIAQIRIQAGAVEEARHLCEEQLAIAERLADVATAAHARWSLGRLALQREAWQEALNQLVESYRLNQQLRRLDGIVFVGLDLGQLLCDAGLHAEGREVLQRSYEGLLTLGQPQLAAQVAELMAKCEPAAGEEQ